MPTPDDDIITSIRQITDLVGVVRSVYDTYGAFEPDIVGALAKLRDDVAQFLGHVRAEWYDKTKLCDDPKRPEGDACRYCPNTCPMPDGGLACLITGHNVADIIFNAENRTQKSTRPARPKIEIKTVMVGTSTPHSDNLPGSRL